MFVLDSAIDDGSIECNGQGLNFKISLRFCVQISGWDDII